MTLPIHDLIQKNVHTLWAGIFVEVLYRRGLRHVVISPGSSSSAWAMAFYLHPGLKKKVILDERVAGFFALGLAKASKKPVVLICTSGTAGAQYYPAIIEARMSGVPLIVVTADRPPEARFVQSEQTINQTQLYGSMPVWYRELPVPRVDFGLFCMLRDQAIDIYDHAYAPAWGPVHVNAPLPYPIHLNADESDNYCQLLNKVVAPEFLEMVAPYVSWPMHLDKNLGQDFIHRLKQYKKGIITVGAAYGVDDEKIMDGVASVSAALGWPVLVDALSPVRFCEGPVSYTVAHYDLILRNPEIAAALKPEVCLHVGRLPTSKVLRHWLSEASTISYHLEPRIESADPLFRGVQHMRYGVWQLAKHCVDVQPADTGYAHQWLNLDRQLTSHIKRAWQDEVAMAECMVPWYLSQYLPKNTPLFISTSMPIRECEAFMLKNHQRLLSFCNRGANGLDGLIATSFGISEALERPSVLLIGDLGFLHDHAALLCHRNGFSGSLTIICIDNGGGSIFRYLGIAEAPASMFQDLWLTPQIADIPGIAKNYGLDVQVPNSWKSFVNLIENLPNKGTRLIYFKTDGRGDFAQRKAWIQSFVKNLTLS